MAIEYNYESKWCLLGRMGQGDFGLIPEMDVCNSLSFAPI